MRFSMDKKELIAFEKQIADQFDNGELPYLVHLSGGNEDVLIEIFKDVRQGDYIFSTHRSHYHYLLAGGSPDRLERLIMEGKSMFVFDRAINFYSSSIVCATPSIAAGVAWALKRKGSKNKVWCFIGDGAEDEGHFYEAVRYVDGWGLPCEFIVEDNDRSVFSTKDERYGGSLFNWPSCVSRYSYIPTYPHGGTNTGGWLKFKNEAKVDSMPLQSPIGKYVDPTDLSYKEASKESMDRLNKLGYMFVGYNVEHGSAYGSMAGISSLYKIETPLAENLMIGLAIGMAMEGFKSVLFFERHDFLFNALDAIVNQLDKGQYLSGGDFKFPVIIKAVVGSVKPFYAGLTHTSNLSNLMREAVTFPVIEPSTPGELIGAYRYASNVDGPVFISEDKELY